MKILFHVPIPIIVRVSTPHVTMTKLAQPITPHAQIMILVEEVIIIVQEVNQEVPIMATA